MSISQEKYTMGTTFLFLLFVSCLVVISGCPSGWLQHGSTCYYFSRKSANSWAEASSYCMAFGYKLAEPEQDIEVNFIKETIKGIAGSAPYFLGGSDFFVEGEWIWSTSQTKIAPHNWEPSEPNNIGAGEDCLVVNHDVLWNDIPCSLPGPFICQAEAMDVNIVG